MRKKSILSIVGVLMIFGCIYSGRNVPSRQKNDSNREVAAENAPAVTSNEGEENSDSAFDEDSQLSTGITEENLINDQFDEVFPSFYVSKDYSDIGLGVDMETVYNDYNWLGYTRIELLNHVVTINPDNENPDPRFGTQDELTINLYYEDPQGAYYYCRRIVSLHTYWGSQLKWTDPVDLDDVENSYGDISGLKESYWRIDGNTAGSFYLESILESDDTVRNLIETNYAEPYYEAYVHFESIPAPEKGSESKGLCPRTYWYWTRETGQLVVGEVLYVIDDTIIRRKIIGVGGYYGNPELRMTMDTHYLLFDFYDEKGCQFYFSTKDFKRVNESDYNQVLSGEKRNVSVTQKEDEPKAEETQNYSSSYILPESDTRFLDQKDLQGLSADECRIARNELYARYGRRFNDEELQKHFDACDWYYGTINPEDFDESILNEYEKANRDLIVQYEKDMGYR